MPTYSPFQGGWGDVKAENPNRGGTELSEAKSETSAANLISNFDIRASNF